jgi:uncharacterized membrane protein
MGLGGWLTVLGCIALVVGLVLILAWALGKLGDRQDRGGSRVVGPTVPPTSDAVEVLRLRFARGEMTAEEYREARQVLEAGQ